MGMFLALVSNVYLIFGNIEYYQKVIKIAASSAGSDLATARPFTQNVECLLTSFRE